MDPRSGRSPSPKPSTNKDDSQGLIESLISSYKSWVLEPTETSVQPPSPESVKEQRVKVVSSASNRESAEVPAFPSIAELSRQCVSAFETCMRYEGLMDHQWAENRFADFNLFVDGVGALSTSTASLDSRFESRPDDLILVQSILTMLKDFLAECISCAKAQSNIDAATKKVDSSLENLALIAVAIRRTGIRSRLARADGRFNPEEHGELGAFLRIICLRQHTRNDLSIEVGKEAQSGGFKFERLSTEERIKVSEKFKPSDTQQRLIEVNLRRRNRFLRAQEHSEKLKSRQSDKRESASNTRRELGSENARLPNMAPVSQESTQRSPTGDPDGGHSPPASSLPETKASTAEGTFQIPKSKRTASQPAMTAITALTAAAQYPTAPSLSQNSTIFKCPCCCQALPAEFSTNGDLWKKHLSEDISPYTCILPDCSTPFTTYNTVLDWEKHFKREHRPCRVCPLCENSDIVFSGMETLVTHIETEHAESASPDFVQTAISWSGVTTIGISQCPLCDSSGPEHAPEFIRHVLGCIHDFSLYSLPWAGNSQDGVSQHDWTYNLGNIGDEESPMRRWFKYGLDIVQEGSRMELSLRKCDGTQVEESHPTNDYFKESENGFFGSASSHSSLEAFQHSSESSDWTDENERGNHKIYTTYHPWLESSEKLRAAISNLKDEVVGVRPIKIAIIDDGINIVEDIINKTKKGISFFQDEETGRCLPFRMASGTMNHGTVIAMFVCTMCPKVNLYICRLNKTTLPTGDGCITMESAAMAVEWATEQRVNIICMAWTIEENAENADTQKRLENALVRADDEDIIMVSAADNLGRNSTKTWPGKSGKCIRIGASTKVRGLSSFISQGDVELLFSGEEIPLRIPESVSSEEMTFGSSSAAVAIGAGAAGLLLYLDRLAEKGGEKEGEWVPLRGREAMKRILVAMSGLGDNEASFEMFNRLEFDEFYFQYDLEQSCARLRDILGPLKADRMHTWSKLQSALAHFKTKSIWGGGSHNGRRNAISE